MDLLKFMSILPLDADPAANQPAAGGGLVQILILVAMVAVMYFVMIRPQRKRDKDSKKMRESIQIGDEIVTIGGIVGRVVSVKEDIMVIETGSDRSKIRIKKWAVQSNETIHDDA